jgi:pilus assembly protein CpaC
MFSINSGRKPIARLLGATLIAVISANQISHAQELNAPLPPTGAFPALAALPALPPQPSLGAPDASALVQTPATAEPVIHKIKAANERMEMTVNSSRVLSLDQNIPRAQVNNKDIVELTPLSPNEIQVAAKKPGVTQINLWNDKGQIYTVDCIVYGDARELQELLNTQFPAANLKVRPIANSVYIRGFVDQPDTVSQIIQIAQDYYPKVIPDIRVGGMQQILLHVKVAEINRTKARNLGFDFAALNGNSFVSTSISNLIAPGTIVPAIGHGDTVRFGLVDGNNAFFGFLDALRKDDLLKIMADPTLVTVSGRPAQFKAGGEIPYPSNATLNGVSISYRDTGITVDFVPVVLGNGNLRLEVRPVERELDETKTIAIAPGFDAPAFTLRQVDTGVEMHAGQTLAIAGLVLKRVRAERTEIPWLGEAPWIGAAFRHNKQVEEEIELLFLVTPELVAALDPCEAPQCLPGMHSDVPNDCQEFWRGYIEVPSKGPCGPGCGCGAGGGYGPEGEMLPSGSQPIEPIAPGKPTPAGSSAERATPRSAGVSTAGATRSSSIPANGQNRYSPSNPQEPRSASRTSGGTSGPGFIGPVGYDVLN